MHLAEEATIDARRYPCNGRQYASTAQVVSPAIALLCTNIRKHKRHQSLEALQRSTGVCIKDHALGDSQHTRPWAALWCICWNIVSSTANLQQPSCVAMVLSSPHVALEAQWAEMTPQC